MKAIFLIPLFLVSQLMTGQDLDIVSVNYSISRLKHNDSVASAQQAEVKIRYPLFKNDIHLILGSLGYKNLNLNEILDPELNSVHAVTANLAWQKQLSEKSSFTIVTQFGLFSDMKDISEKDFRYSVGFRYKQTHSAKLKTGYGLGYARQFFGNQVIPFIEVDFRPNKRWSFTGQLPMKPKVLYHFNEKFRVGLELSGDASSYRLSESTFQDNFIQLNQWLLLSKMEYKLAKSLLLSVDLGYNIKQSYRMFENTSNNTWTIFTIPLGKKPEPDAIIDGKGPYCNIGLRFGIFKS